MEQTKNIILQTMTVFALLLVAQSAMSQATTDVSFSSISSFEDRDNALRIIGTEKGTRAPLNILLYRYNKSARLDDAPSIPDCMPYIITMMERSGTFNFTLSYIARPDPLVFSATDVVRGCGLEVAGAMAG